MVNDYHVSNTRMKLNRHPIIWIRSLIDDAIKQGSIDASARNEFSYYQYNPSSLQDLRSEFLIQPGELCTDNFLNLIIDIPEGYELAINSRVYSFGKIVHIPMIDFGYKGSNPVEDSQLKEFCNYWGLTFNVYFSGRSFHGYGNRLLEHEEWIKYMGSLLLLNKKGGSKLIDERWIGHRLLGGYSALRWSKNTSHYKKFPTKCGVIGPDHLEIDVENSWKSRYSAR